MWPMRTVLGGLAQIQLARAAAPDLVEWTTTIRRPDLRADRRRVALLVPGVYPPQLVKDAQALAAEIDKAEAEERARARAGLAALVRR